MGFDFICGKGDTPGYAYYQCSTCSVVFLAEIGKLGVCKYCTTGKKMEKYVYLRLREIWPMKTIVYQYYIQDCMNKRMLKFDFAIFDAITPWNLPIGTAEADEHTHFRQVYYGTKRYTRMKMTDNELEKLKCLVELKILMYHINSFSSSDMTTKILGFRKKIETDREIMKNMIKEISGTTDPLEKVRLYAKHQLACHPAFIYGVTDSSIAIEVARIYRLLLSMSEMH